MGMLVDVHDQVDLTLEEQRIFKPSNYFRQLELFPQVNDNDIMITLLYLKRYREIELLVKDYEEHQEDFKLTVIEGDASRKLSSEEIYSNKTANAYILYAEKQPMIYQELKRRLDKLNRAHNLIRAKNVETEDEIKKAIQLRYIRGYSYKNALLFLRTSSRTFDRRLAEGIVSITNTLKLWGELDTQWKF